MICIPCRKAADSQTVYQTILAEDILPVATGTELAETLAADAKKFLRMHAACPGYTWCDCQHVIRISVA